MIELFRYLRVINVLAKFEKWSVKHYGRESVNGDFPCAKLENAKKIAKILFADDEKTRNLYWLPC